MIRDNVYEIMYFERNMWFMLEFLKVTNKKFKYIIKNSISFIRKKIRKEVNFVHSVYILNANINKFSYI